MGAIMNAAPRTPAGRFRTSRHQRARRSPKTASATRGRLRHPARVNGADYARLVLLAALWGGAFIFLRVPRRCSVRPGPRSVACCSAGSRCSPGFASAGFDSGLRRHARFYLLIGTVNIAAAVCALFVCGDARPRVAAFDRQRNSADFRACLERAVSRRARHAAQGSRSRARHRRRRADCPAPDGDRAAQSSAAVAAALASVLLLWSTPACS